LKQALKTDNILRVKEEDSYEKGIDWYFLNIFYRFVNVSGPIPVGLSKKEVQQIVIVKKKSAPEPSGPIAVGLSKEEVQKIVEDSLDKKLRPIVRMMTESKNTKPSLTEIIGGIGYIFGLMGIALYFKNRGKKP